MAKVLLICLYEVNYVGVRYLASYLKERGHSPSILHFKNYGFAVKSSLLDDNLDAYSFSARGFNFSCVYDASPITEKEYALVTEHISNIKPDIIGVSARSTQKPHIPKLVQSIKNAGSNATLVAGGYGPTLEPEVFLNFGFEIILRGDGEETLFELVEALEKKENYSNILNLSFFENGKLIENKMRAQVKDINIYPKPLYGDEYCAFIENNKLCENHDKALAGSTYSTMLGRGCVGSCTYCCAGHWYDQYKKDHKVVAKNRIRDLDLAIEELKQIDKTKFTSVGFADELFTAPKEKMLHFFKRYKEEVNLPFFLYLSYEQCLRNEEIFQSALDANWASSSVGAQTGSEHLARNLYGRKNKNEDYCNYIKKLFDNSIEYAVHLIGGHCYETEEDFNATLDFVKQLPFDLTNRRLGNLLHVKLRILPHTPIEKLMPRYYDEQVSNRDWFYKTLLLEFRLILNDEEFEELRNIKLYKENPDLLAGFYRLSLCKLQSNYFKDLAEKYEGKPVLFYGAGQLYEFNKEIFAGCDSKAILLNDAFITPDCKMKDNIPILPISELHNMDKDMPIISFSNHGACNMRRTLMKDYKVKSENIYTVTSLLSWNLKKKTNFIPY